MAVARAWTLAYGVMLDVQWPDSIPDTFAQQYGVSQLRDSEAPDIPEDIHRDARRYAEGTVAEVKGTGVSSPRSGGTSLPPRHPPHLLSTILRRETT